MIPYYKKKAQDSAQGTSEEEGESDQHEHEKQLNAAIHTSMDEEYTSKFLEFGYLVLFGAAFPLLALLLLVTTAVELRTNATRFIENFQRPK